MSTHLKMMEQMDIQARKIAIQESVIAELLAVAKEAKKCLLDAGSDGHVITFEESQNNRKVFGALILAIAKADGRP